MTFQTSFDSAQQHVPYRKQRLRIIVGFLLIFIIGFIAGQRHAIRAAVSGADGEIQIDKVLDLYGKTRSSAVSFDQFWDMWDTIKKNYVDQPVNDVHLFYGALEGMVQGLQDPYSMYFPPAKASEFVNALSGEFEGIGAEVGFDDAGQLVIIAPLPKSPAEAAGIRPGDAVLLINGSSTVGISLDEAVTKIKGPAGTKVTLTIIHKLEQKPREIVITRQVINVPTVISEQETDGLVYVRISQFNQDTWKDFDAAVESITKRAAPKGIILDLRSNPGGYLDASIAVASEWVKNGVIVRERGNSGKNVEHETIGTHRLADIPTVVLVDEGTASGSEIVAGALQDYDVATIIGQKTFGKGSVQDFQLLPDGSALKLTIARWFTPNNQQIDKHGITPDILLDQQFTTSTPQGGTDVTVVDIGRNKAKEYLLKK